MGASLVYWNRGLYELAMRGLYGRHYPARFDAVAELIPRGARVLDVCCGPGLLYERRLREKGVEYTGLDVNPAFVRRVERLGGRGILGDLSRDEGLPSAEFVVMQASLYQFLPDASAVACRLLDAATRAVVLAEPVRNLATSGRPLLARIGRLATDAGRGATPWRFTERTLDDLVASLPTRPLRGFLIPGGREKVYLLAADGPVDSRGGGAPP
jgi:SAM-dependent methyltransferase